MQQQDPYRPVCEVGQMGQVKTESIAECRPGKSFRDYLPYVPQKRVGADRAPEIRRSEGSMCEESFRKNVPKVPHEYGWGTLGHIRSGVLHGERVQKLLWKSAPCAPCRSEVI